MSSLEFAIFNDGIPSSVFYGENSEHDVVQMIPDDAIEELFPPSEADVSCSFFSAVGFYLKDILLRI